MLNNKTSSSLYRYLYTKSKNACMHACMHAYILYTYILCMQNKELCIKGIALHLNLKLRALNLAQH